MSGFEKAVKILKPNLKMIWWRPNLKENRRCEVVMWKMNINEFLVTFWYFLQKFRNYRHRTHPTKFFHFIFCPSANPHVFFILHKQFQLNFEKNNYFRLHLAGLRLSLSLQVQSKEIFFHPLEKEVSSSTHELQSKRIEKKILRELSFTLDEYNQCYCYIDYII